MVEKFKSNFVKVDIWQQFCSDKLGKIGARASIRRTQERSQKITFSSSFVSSYDDDVRVGSENGGGCFDWATFTEHPA